MTTNPTTPCLEQRMQKLPNLSVDLVAAAQAYPGRLAGLDASRLQALQEAYQRFLYLAALHPDLSLAPTVEIDEMWHLHMLHPKAYQHDCQSGLGYLMDHNAGFGSTVEERPILLAEFQKTVELWAAAFGEGYGVVHGQVTSGGETTNCNKEPSPTNCDKTPSPAPPPTNCDKPAAPAPTNCDKPLAPTNCDKPIAPTNCDKAIAPTNCDKAKSSVLAPGSGIFSVDLVEAARRSEGNPLAELSSEALNGVLARYEAFLTSNLERPQDPNVYVAWRLHMLHPVAYRADCLAILGSVKDHAVVRELALV